MPNTVPKDQDGWVSLRLDAFGEGIVPPVTLGTFQLGVETDGGQHTYFAINKGSATHYTYRNDEPVGEFNATIKVGDVLRIERQGTQLQLLRNGNAEPVATIAEVANGAIRFRMRLLRRAATITPQQASYSTGSCPPFVVLKHRLDASYLQQTDDVLRFKFQQRYATVNNQPEAINYIVYDWQRNSALSGSFDAQYGINWSEIQVGSLPNNIFYTLEITANKGEHYLLRFKTKQP